MYSINEINAVKEALQLNVRADNRLFKEPRKLTVTCSTKPGFALVTLGKTMITARTTAKLVVPSTEKPSEGAHTINIFAPNVLTRSQIIIFQTYLRNLWKNLRIIENDTLCVKIGEKAWNLETSIVISNDDGGLLDCSIIAIYVSLSQLRFPAFDSTTGSLFPASQKRTHKAAFSVKPICVTVAFITEQDQVVQIEDGHSASEQTVSIHAQKQYISHPKRKIIVDPTFLELEASSGFASFIFSEHLEQVYLDSKHPSDIETIDASRELAKTVAESWKLILETVVDNSDRSHDDDGISCVGSPEDFINYKPPKIETNTKDITKQGFAPFEVWNSSVAEPFVLDFFKVIENETREKGTTENSNQENNNWVLSSLMI